MTITADQYNELKNRLSKVEVLLSRQQAINDARNSVEIQVSDQFESQGVTCPKCKMQVDPFDKEVCPNRDNDCYSGLKAIKLESV